MIFINSHVILFNLPLPLDGKICFVNSDGGKDRRGGVTCHVLFAYEVGEILYGCVGLLKLFIHCHRSFLAQFPFSSL